MNFPTTSQPDPHTDVGKLTNQQILEKAIQKAITGGWKGFTSTIKSVHYHKGKIERNVLMTFHATDGDITIMYNLEAIIFNHDFAKALWQKGNTFKHKDGTLITIDNRNYWKAKLRSMVVANNPIKYLGEHI